MTAPLPNPRYERKFVAKDMALTEVLAMVRRHPAGFSVAYSPRRVNNIYLDSPTLTAYQEHINGAAERVKTRVRWYGAWNGAQHAACIERKLKCGLVSGKVSHPLSPLVADGHSCAEELNEAFESAGLPPVFRVSLRHLQPSLFNQYQRQYFLSGDRRFRLTVDSELRFGPPQNFNTQPNARPTELLVVLELKFAPEHAALAPCITNHWPFRLTRCSKYVLGIRSTYR